MSRFAATLGCDVRLQMRNGFYWAVAFMLGILAVLITQLPSFDWSRVMAPLVLCNLVVATFYFLAGLVLLEKGEGTLEAQIVTPLTTGEYLGSKVATLVALSVVENVAIVLIACGTGFSMLPLVLGIVLAAAIYCLAGFIAVARYDSINEYLFPSMLWVAFFSLPFLHYAGLWTSPLMYLHPLQAPLVLLRGAFFPLAGWEWIYGVAYSALWIALTFGWSLRSFQRFVVARAGGTGMRAAAILRALGPIDAKSLLRDSMLRWMFVLPVLLALAFRWGVPPVTTWLAREFDVDLAPYHPLMVSILVLIQPMLFGSVMGFLLLDEKDDRTLTALQVTPLTIRGYLVYRLGMPMLLSVVMTLIAIPISGLEAIGLGGQLLAASAAAPLAPAFALFIAAFARNKVQGFALMKAAGGINWPPAIAWFVDSDWQWAFGLCPTYWPAKLYWELAGGGGGVLPALGIGVAYFALLTLLFLRRFDRVMHR